MSQMPSLLDQRDEAKLVAQLHRIPQHCQEGLYDYLRYGLPPGHFLSAVLTNDLYEACGRADEMNRTALAEYVFVLYNCAPSEAWGTRHKVQVWIERGMALRRQVAAS